MGGAARLGDIKVLIFLLQISIIIHSSRHIAKSDIILSGSHESVSFHY